MLKEYMKSFINESMLFKNQSNLVNNIKYTLIFIFLYHGKLKGLMWTCQNHSTLTNE